MNDIELCQELMERAEEYQKQKEREFAIAELGKLKSKIELMDFDFGDYYDDTNTIIEMVSKVIDKSIAELKGKQK